MIRLIIVIALFLTSLLCIFKAPTYMLWYVQILATEFSLIFIALILIILAVTFKMLPYRTITFIIAIAAIFLFLTPIFGAIKISNALGKNLKMSFNEDTENNSSPLSFQKLLGLQREAQLIPQAIIYDSAKNLSLDYYAAKAPGNKPCIIVVHGGSWAGGDSKQLPELNTHLALKGYNVVSINYRLAPTFKNPAPIEDIQKCIDFLSANQAKYKIDSSKFILLGRSAGAQLVLAAAYTNISKNIKGVISYYGPADMIWGYQNPAKKAVMDSKKVMEDFLGGTYDQAKPQYEACSPINLLKPGAVPTLLIQGKNDPLVAYEHSVRLEKKLLQYKVPYYFLSLPWATHGCDYTLNGPSGQLSVFAVDNFIEHVVK